MAKGAGDDGGRSVLARLEREDSGLFSTNPMQWAREQAAERALTPKPPPAMEEETPAPTPQPTAVYEAEGDPYKYQLNPDQSVTLIQNGAPGETLKEGPAYTAIMAQIKSGQLKGGPPPSSPMGTPPPADGGRSIADMRKDDREVLGWGLPEGEGFLQEVKRRGH